MELVLVLPLFLLLVFSIVEFSLLMSAQTRIANACQSGARMMSLTGASAEEIQSQVLSLLGPNLAKDCQIDVQPAAHPGEIGHVSVRLPMKNASPDLLWIAGYGLAGRTMDSSASMVMERCREASVEFQTY
ncbi:MAG: TadE/TadG family type IV pilus assembly protein [Planctomycetota bacterium]